MKWSQLVLLLSGNTWLRLELFFPSITFLSQVCKAPRYDNPNLNLSKYLTDIFFFLKPQMSFHGYLSDWLLSRAYAWLLTSGLHNARGNGDVQDPVCQLFLRWGASFCKLVVYGMEGIPLCVLGDEWETWASLESQGLESPQLGVAAKFLSTTELLTEALKSLISITFWQVLLVMWLEIFLFPSYPFSLDSLSPFSDMEASMAICSRPQGVRFSLTLIGRLFIFQERKGEKVFYSLSWTAPQEAPFTGDRSN